MDGGLGLIAGSGWASGLNLYGVVALLGLAGRLGWAEVPDPLTGAWVLGGAGALYLLEFVADKVPYLDNLWDAAHTVIRPVGAAALGYLLAGDLEGLNQPLAAGASGALAFVGHATKATSRAAINTSPEPASNIVVSLFEDGLVAAMVWLALEHPVVAGVLVALFVLAGAWLITRLWRLAVTRLRRLSRRRERV